MDLDYSYIEEQINKFFDNGTEYDWKKQWNTINEAFEAIFFLLNEYRSERVTFFVLNVAKTLLKENWRDINESLIETAVIKCLDIINSNVKLSFQVSSVLCSILALICYLETRFVSQLNIYNSKLLMLTYSFILENGYNLTLTNNSDLSSIIKNSLDSLMDLLHQSELSSEWLSLHTEVFKWKEPCQMIVFFPRIVEALHNPEYISQVLELFEILLSYEFTNNSSDDMIYVHDFLMTMVEYLESLAETFEAGVFTENDVNRASFAWCQIIDYSHEFYMDPSRIHITETIFSSLFKCMESLHHHRPVSELLLMIETLFALVKLYLENTKTCPPFFYGEVLPNLFDFLIRILEDKVFAKNELKLIFRDLLVTKKVYLVIKNHIENSSPGVYFAVSYMIGKPKEVFANLAFESLYTMNPPPYSAIDFLIQCSNSIVDRVTEILPQVFAMISENINDYAKSLAKLTKIRPSFFITDQYIPQIIQLMADVETENNVFIICSCINILTQYDYDDDVVSMFSQILDTSISLYQGFLQYDIQYGLNFFDQLVKQSVKTYNDSFGDAFHTLISAMINESRSFFEEYIPEYSLQFSRTIARAYRKKWIDSSCSEINDFIFNWISSLTNDQLTSFHIQIIQFLLPDMANDDLVVQIINNSVDIHEVSYVRSLIGLCGAHYVQNQSNLALNYIYSLLSASSETIQEALFESLQLIINSDRIQIPIQEIAEQYISESLQKLPSLQCQKSLDLLILLSRKIPISTIAELHVTLAQGHQKAKEFAEAFTGNDQNKKIETYYFLLEYLENDRDRF